MNIIIFSKDRAMQLDLCLRSIKKYVEHPEVIVILTWDSQEYLDGYAKLLHKHRDVAFIEQGNFKKTLRRTIKDTESLVCMMVDDSIFIRRFAQVSQLLCELGLAMNTDTYKCISLMLSPEVDYCYAKDQKYIPQTLSWNWDGGFHKWNWSVEASWSDWGYPHQVGGNLWLKDYLLKITKWISFKNPNELESKLNFPLRRRRYDTRWMFCFNKQRILTIPINYIPKKEAENRNSGLYSLEELNDKFMNGYQIKLPKKVKSNAICKEVEIEFENSKRN